MKYVMYFDSDCKFVCVYQIVGSELTIKNIYGKEDNQYLKSYCEEVKINLISYIQLDSIESVLKTMTNFPVTFVVVGGVRTRSKVIPNCKSNRIEYFKKENKTVSMDKVSRIVQLMCLNRNIFK